tara:strand:+ start:15170 stop:15466 length:297 start_codon:yes stop_codon:yes gene_type:complete
MSTESTEALIERVLAEHSIGAFCGTDTACNHDRTWRTNAEHRAHVAAAITQALAEQRTVEQPRRLCDPIDTTWAEDAAASHRALYDTDSGRRDKWSER